MPMILVDSYQWSTTEKKNTAVLHSSVMARRVSINWIVLHSKADDSLPLAGWPMDGIDVKIASRILELNYMHVLRASFFNKLFFFW